MLTLFHDFTSPASAVAVRRAQRLVSDGLAVEFEGFDAIGIEMILPVTIDVVDEIDRLRDVAAAEDVVLRRPPGLPPTALAHALVNAVADTGSGAAMPLRDTIYTAFWRDGRDISDRAVLMTVAFQAGVDPAIAERALDATGATVAVRRRTAAHRREGVGGVPTILAQRTLVPGLMDEDDMRALAAL